MTMRTRVAAAVVMAAVAGMWICATSAEEAKPAVKTCTIAADDLAKAISDLEAVSKTIPADQKETVAKLDDAMKILRAAKTSATSQPAASTGDTFTGAVESTKTEKRPRLVVGNTHYELKAGEKADSAVTATLAKISEGDATGDYTVKGTTTTVEGKATLLVESITKK